MLTKISLKNFKGFKSAVIELKPITILIGPNNSGKSSLIKSLVLIQQTLAKASNVVINTDGYKFGNFGDMIYQRHEKNKKEINFIFEFSDNTLIDFIIHEDVKKNIFLKKFSCRTSEFDYSLSNLNSNDFDIEGNIRKSNKHYINIHQHVKKEKKLLEFKLNPDFYRDSFFIKLKSIGDISNLINLYFNKKKLEGQSFLFNWDNVPGDDTNILLKFLKNYLAVNWVEKPLQTKSPDKKVILISDNKNSVKIEINKVKKKAILTINNSTTYNLRVEEKNGKLNIHDSYDYSIENISNSIKFYLSMVNSTNDFHQKVKNEFTNIKYIGPIREEPNRTYDIEVFNDVGNMGEHAIQILAKDISLRNMVEKHFKNMEIADKLQIAKTSKQNTFEFKLKTKLTDIAVNLVDMGCGTSQLLPIIVQSLLPKKESLIVIEQPEAHLHPKVQIDLADFFISLANKKKMFLLETHSDYFIERIRYGIANEMISTEDVAIYFVEPNESENCSEISKIKINSNGQYIGLPENYISNFKLEEIRKMTKKLLEKSLKK